jgi:hypothetical protein
MTRACGADDIKNILHPALFRKLRFQMIDDSRKIFIAVDVRFWAETREILR